MRWNEFPCNLLVTEVVADIILGGWLLEELMEFFEFSSKVGAIITPYKKREAASRDERFRQAMNASEVRSETNSRCTALTEREINMHTYV